MQSKAEVLVREAMLGDFEAIAGLMEEALSPYYDGDHTAHAQRIFSTHVDGGVDDVGHFSFEQKMFLATYQSDIAGMVHVVGKRQGTYKISPLIVSPEYRGRYGIGSMLLAQAEEYAKSRYARQIYCTVADKNHSALQFFRKKGYIVAGSSESHYKAGIREFMLYKLFIDYLVEKAFDRPNISVVPFEEQFREQTSALILEKLPNYFGGIDEKWLDALYDGFYRKQSGDVNAKYKLIYLATDQNGNVLGVAGVTPKKGQPIKLMPFVANSQQAFEAMLSDLPHILKPYGHKLYLHIVPSVKETIALQRLDWTLDAAMPAAYCDEYVTQQWGFVLEGELMRTIRVKQRFFDDIMSGRKTREVRVGYDHILTIQPGERIKLSTHTNASIVRVEAIYRYRSFKEMLARQDAGSIAPGLGAESVLELLQRIYPPDKERLGVIVLSLIPEK